MKTIELNQNISEKVLEYDHNPVIEIVRIAYSTNNKDWKSKVSNSYLKIKISCYDNEDNHKSSSEYMLTFGEFLDPNILKPIFSINRIFKFENDSHFFKEVANLSWRATIDLYNLKIEENEKIIIDILDSKHFRERVIDWEKRVKMLLENISEWISDHDEIQITHSKNVVLYEQLMKTFSVPKIELPTVDIKIKNKTVLYFKPFGLWIIGANGRIDLLSKKGSYIIIDKADNFQKPEWILYQINNRRKGVELNKEVFLNLLGK